MKKFLLAFLLAAAPALAVNYPFSVTFDIPPANDATIEYVVEHRQPNGTFVEVAKGPTSPIKFTLNVPYGTFTGRVFARVRDNPLPRNVASDTSAVAVHDVTPLPPSNVKITYGIDGTTTLQVQSGSTMTITPNRATPTKK